MKRFILILLIMAPIVATAQVQPSASPVKKGLSEVLSAYSEEYGYSFFEIGEDMFKAFCELEHADSTSIALFKKIKSVKMLERVYSDEELEAMDLENPDQVVDTSLYTEITEALDISGFTQLLKSRNNHQVTLFLKKEHAKGDNEFLLITNRMVIDIRGDIVIKTIYQMEEMMGWVGQILPN